MADAGGGFGGLHEDDAGFELEGSFHGVDRKRLAVGGGDDVDGTAEGLSEGCPALAELAGGEDEDAVAGAGEIGHGGFHGAGAGGGEQDDIVGGADEVFEPGEDAGEESAELGGAVVDIGGGHGELRGGEEGGWAGGEETGFADHVDIVWRGGGGCTSLGTVVKSKLRGFFAALGMTTKKRRRMTIKQQRGSGGSYNLS